MENCGYCKWEYPDSLLNQMFIGGSIKGKPGYTVPICGICALEIGNMVLDIKRTSFDGEIAEHMRQLAIKWRKNNKHRAPKETANGR